MGNKGFPFEVPSSVIGVSLTILLSVLGLVFAQVTDLRKQRELLSSKVEQQRETNHKQVP